MRIIVSLVFSLCLMACEVRTNSESDQVAKGVTTDQLPRTDDLQRIKDCTEQSDRMVKRNRWIEGQLADGMYLFGEVTFTGWESHYSPKYKRCYLRATFFTSEAPDDKISFHHLYDAFEGRLLAICNDGSLGIAKLFCSIEEKVTSDLITPDRHSGDCEQCRSFVADRWNN